MKKIYIILSIIAAVIILAVLIFRFMPAKYITNILGSDNTVSSLACSYPVRIAGDSMEPYFKNGQITIFNKCFTQEDIIVDKIIAFKDGDVVRLGIINSLENLAEGLTYKVIQSNRQDKISDVLYNQIIAIYKQGFDEQTQKETTEQSGEPTEIKTSDYNLILPAGWQIAQEDDRQSIFIYINETSENDFKTYLSISQDQIRGDTFANYINSLKNQIKESAPGISFDNENNVKINGRDALVMDGYVRQNNTDFKILTVAIKGENNDVWILNFNATEDKWENNVPIFEQILNSFNIK